MVDYSSSPSAEQEFPEELPPVQPPSAGFIVQLFVVPALIVLAIVGVWALFGRMAAGEQDWHQLVNDLQSGNQHIRNRGMFGLAQVLDADRRLGEQGQHLSENPEIGRALATRLDAELKRVGQGKTEQEEIVTSQVYLVRTLGLLDQPDVTFPALQTALDPQYDPEVRKGAVTSIALIAGRDAEQMPPVEVESTVQALGQLATDPDPLLRQTAAFTLGLFDHPDAKQRLLVSLEDEDAKTRVNAAIALARHGSTAGYPVFRQVLDDARQPVAESESRDAQFEQLVILKNVLRAVADLAVNLDPDQRREMIRAIEPVSETYSEPQIRVAAQGALATLKEVR